MAERQAEIPDLTFELIADTINANFISLDHARRIGFIIAKHSFFALNGTMEKGSLRISCQNYHKNPQTPLRAKMEVCPEDSIPIILRLGEEGDQIFVTLFRVARSKLNALIKTEDIESL